MINIRDVELPNEGPPAALKSGMVVETKRGRFVIGDANTAGGECSCCFFIGPSDVLRWVQLLDCP